MLERMMHLVEEELWQGRHRAYPRPAFRFLSGYRPSHLTAFRERGPQWSVVA